MTVVGNICGEDSNSIAKRDLGISHDDRAVSVAFNTLRDAGSIVVVNRRLHSQPRR